MSRSAWTSIVALWLLASFFASSGTAISASGEAWLTVTLETPESCAVPVVLELDSVELRYDEGDEQLPVLGQKFDARELAGAPSRIVDVPVPAGTVRRLSLRISSLEGEVAGATVRPALPDTLLRFQLDREVQAAEGMLLRLRWEPAPIDPEAERHELMVGLLPEPSLSRGAVAFVSNEASSTLSVIDRFARHLVEVVVVGDGPRGMAVSEREQRLYVALSMDDEVVALDLSLLRRVESAPLRTGDEPSRLLLSPDETTLYVLLRASNAIAVLDVPSLSERARISLGNRPVGMALNPQTGVIYVSAELSSEVVAIDPLLGEVIHRLSLAGGAGELAFAGFQGPLYAAEASGRRIVAIDAIEWKLSGQLELCATASGLAFHGLSGHLFAAESLCQRVSLVEPSRQLQLRVMETDGRPGLLTLDREQRELWITLPEDDAVLVANANSRRVLSNIDCGHRPYAIAVP